MIDYGVKIEDILSLKPFQKAKIVAGGNNSLQRVVKSINVVEVPDIKEWEIKDELLLTQGFSFTDKKRRKELLEIMVEKGASGLCMKPKRYLEKIPEDTIEYANLFEFPLIELPFELRFSEIIASVMQLISSKQTMILEQSVKIHKELMNIVISGGDVRCICRKISELINNTVFVEDKFGELLAYSIKANSEDEKKVIENFLEKLYKEHKDYASNYNVVKFPILKELKIVGYICVLETIKALTGIDIMALENATTVIALEIMKKETIEEIEKRHINEFIDIIFSKIIEKDEEIIQRGKHYGIDLEKNYNVILIQFKYNEIHNQKNISFKEKLDKKDYVQQLSNKLHDIIRFTLLMEGHRGIVGTKEGDFVILIETDKYKDNNLLKKELNELIHKIDLKIERELRIENNNTKFLISRQYKGTYISKGYDEVKNALNIVKSNDYISSKVIHFDELGFFRFLHYIPKKDLESFLREYIQPLIEYDQKNDFQLIKTLEAYFMHKCNIKDTASYLHVHYNTVVYRIQKIKDILGFDLEEWNVSLNLQLALRIINLFTQIE